MVLDELGSSLSGFAPGAASLARYAWVLYLFVGLAVIVFCGWLWKINNERKKQWTHKLRLTRQLADGKLSEEVVINMKRFPLVKNASVFQLQTPVLGSYLMPELDSYTGLNEFSIIIDNNNRIYISKGKSLNKDKSCVIVSAKHAGIDLAFEDLKGDWQNQYKVDKKADWAQIAKFMLWGLFIIALMVVTIEVIGQWGQNKLAETEKAQAEVLVYQNLAEALETSLATTNALVILADKIKEMEGSENLQAIVRKRVNATG